MDGPERKPFFDGSDTSKPLFTNEVGMLRRPLKGTAHGSHGPVGKWFGTCRLYRLKRCSRRRAGVLPRHRYSPRPATESKWSGLTTDHCHSSGQAPMRKITHGVWLLEGFPRNMFNVYM